MARHRRSKKGKAAKRAKSKQDEPEDLKKAPHTFVFKRGKVGKYCNELVHNFRKVMEPYTASNLKVRNKNCIADFVSIAGLLNVTHSIIFTRSPIANYVRFCRMPRGPTITFRIHRYTLVRDIVSNIKKPVVFSKQYEHHPLLILNNFSAEGSTGIHVKLVSSMFQNMFPSINVNNIRLGSLRRCVLLNYNADTKIIEFRHYAIKVAPTGLSRGVKKLNQKKIPNLSKFEDMSELITKGALFSDSEAELDDDHGKVLLPQKITARGPVAGQQSMIRLVEIGPRLSMQLIKVEEGLMDGEVMYHDIIRKTPEELQVLKKAKEQKRKLKVKRKQVQEANVKRKEQERDQHKQRSLAGMKRSDPDVEDIEVVKADESTKAVSFKGEEAEEMSSEDDEAEYYRQAVGKEPDEDFVALSKKRRATSSQKDRPLKRRKMDGTHQGPQRDSTQRGDSKTPIKRYPQKGAGRKFGSDRERKFEGEKGGKFSGGKGKFSGPKGKFTGDKGKFDTKGSGGKSGKRFGGDRDSGRKFGGKSNKGAGKNKGKSGRKMTKKR